MKHAFEKARANKLRDMVFESLDNAHDNYPSIVKLSPRVIVGELKEQTTGFEDYRDDEIIPYVQAWLHRNVSSRGD